MWISRISRSLWIGVGFGVLAPLLLFAGPPAAASAFNLNEEIAGAKETIASLEQEISGLNQTIKGIETKKFVIVFEQGQIIAMGEAEFSARLSQQVAIGVITKEQAVARALTVGVLTKATLGALKELRAENQAELVTAKERLKSLNLEKVRLASQPAPKPAIVVTAATYGASCGQPAGNVTTALKSACDGKTVCDYSVDWHVLGDPAYLCKKDFSVQWSCGGGGGGSASAPAEAGFGAKVLLRC